MLEVNKLYNENCLDTMSRMQDCFIDLTVTSPPYDNLRTYNGYSFDFESIAKELYRVTKQGGVVVWVVADATINGSETGTSFRQALFFKEIGFNLETMIYQKDGSPFPCQVRYNNIFEYMFVLTKGKNKTFNPIKEKAKQYLFNKKKLTSSYRQKDGSMKIDKVIYNENKIKDNIWRYLTGYMKTSKDIIAFEHPATFPEQLADDHIWSWSNEGDLVYDCFAGSGTTLKMTVKRKRNYIGSEISAEYCKIAEKRLFNEQKQLKLF